MNDACYLTQCKFCPHTFKSKPFVPLIAAVSGADQRRNAMYQALVKHMMEQHANLLPQLLMAVCFTFGDPTIVEEIDFARWTAHQNTRKFMLPDAAIHNTFAEAGFNRQQIEEVLKLRDALCEMGKFAPASAQPPATIENAEPLSATPQ